MPTTRQPIVRRSAWRPSDFSSKDDFSVTLNEQHVVAFDRALAANRAATRETASISREDFALDDIADDVAAWRDEVLNGRGFVLLRGFPLQRYTEDEIATIYWGLGTYVGRAASQSNLGDYIGHVIDVGGKDQRERAYRNSRELTLHTDRADVLGMLCLQRAMRGGLSGYSSAHTIYNEILATRPELLEPLFEGFQYHRRGEQLPGQPAVTPDKIPVLSEQDGEVSVVFLRNYIDMGAAELEQPLSPLQLEALDLFEEVAARDDIKLTFMLEPGEAVFFNNCVLLHHRTSFEDHPEPARKRHLLRLWLMLDGVRPLAPAVHAYKGTAGIQERADGSTYYTGDAVAEPVDSVQAANSAR
ncbi:MAG: TauD/TfdA family dioxygenase [bacterium]|nr:TauD/TfdA family dioxygenase [bacterium]